MKGRDARVSRLKVGGEELVVIGLSDALAHPALGALTPAEREVVAFVACGLGNAAIAEKRGTSARTVANQLASVYRKLEIGDRHELVALLVRGD